MSVGVGVSFATLISAGNSGGGEGEGGEVVESGGGRSKEVMAGGGQHQWRDMHGVDRAGEGRLKR